MSEKKRVIFIMTDTTRKDMLGCYGDDRMYTPHLDALAKKGIRYDSAYSCQPVCGPARSAIFTGQFPHSNGVVANNLPLGANVKTIGQRLRDKGIHCAYIGKWHLDGSDYFGNGICPEGWDKDYWYDMRCYLEELTEEERRKSRKKKTALEEDIDEKFTYAHRCSDRAVDFIEKHKDEPYFLTVSYDEPHDPCLCPREFYERYLDYSFADVSAFGDTLEEKPLLQQLWAGEDRNKTAEELNKPSEGRAVFLGCNSFVDYEIGRVLDAASRFAPDALIIFTSDHGDMLGAHKLYGKNAAAYKEIANIPLIIYGGEQGRVVCSPASHIDIAPTILDYMDVPVPPVLEGKSMMSQIYDADVKINEEVYMEFTRYEVDHDGFGGLQMMRAVTTEHHKLVINLMDRDEFYDLDHDPTELHNKIEDPDFAEIRNDLHDRILEHMNRTRDPYRGYQWAVRPWRKDKMPLWENDGFTRQREEREYEPWQMDYDTGLPMEKSVRKKDLLDKKGGDRNGEDI